MKVQITCGPPHISTWLSFRDRQMFDYCAAAGEVWAGWVDGEMEACWGVIPPSFMAENAYLWMLDRPIRHPMALMRHSRIVISSLLARWPHLHGHCRPWAGSSRRWLQWLGADFGQPVGDLIPFEIRRP